MNRLVREETDEGIEPSSPSDSSTGGTCGAANATAAVPMGGRAVRDAARGELARGTPSHAQRVRNLGRGVWGYGVVVGWIPADVWPWHYCRRRGWVQIFSRHTKPLVRTRPYVLGDDGRHHLAVKWEAVG